MSKILKTAVQLNLFTDNSLNHAGIVNDLAKSVYKSTFNLLVKEFLNSHITKDIFISSISSVCNSYIKDFNINE